MLCCGVPETQYELYDYDGLLFLELNKEETMRRVRDFAPHLSSSHLT